MNSNCSSDYLIRDFRIPQNLSCFPVFLIHLFQITESAPALSQPGSWARGLVGIWSRWISSSGVYSGGNGGGADFRECCANSSGNFSTKLWVGHAHASPKAQIVRPAMLSPMVFSVCASSVTPPPFNMRSVIFFIQSDPSRHGVHWPHDSCA